MFQNPNNNFIKCPSCNGLLISEEFPAHSCFMIKHIFIDDKIIWISDGKEWYRWYGFPPTEESTEPKKINSSPRSEHPDKTPEDGTEPNFSLSLPHNLHIVYLSRLLKYLC